jgi:hypothetical protein
MGARESKEMERARDLIMNHGWKPIQAAKFLGLSPQAIYLAKWYKDHKEKQNRVTNK